ncbi:aconitase subunit 1 [Caballeronia arvi]|uniref:Aconitase subunit 1 n=1 Tax=Caballeronia arvi TaxID=1777135 RepID=A0A158KJ80_9BURK|nr:aconitase family protein [Caballeronia arvi]SAL81124.1 aconitase subunit 1 [Caballeronia arvi]
MNRSFKGRSLVDGVASADLLYSDVPLSFMGGVDPATGVVTDTHHPLRGQSAKGKILAIPSGRGSCAGSGVLFELLLGEAAPAGLVFAHEETILTLGTIIAEELFGKSIPLINLGDNFQQLSSVAFATMRGNEVLIGRDKAESWDAQGLEPVDIAVGDFSLTAKDRGMLEGEHGPAPRAAMRVVLRAAMLEGAKDLIDVTQAHIDGCFYTGPGSLQFVRKLCELGAQVSVPSSMNAISVDERLWRKQGVDETFGEAAMEVAESYAKMGVKRTFTCAPYLLDTAPKFGDQIVWAESNAVVYANSVIGARTMKYPDYLDICIAITGRAPNMDCHVEKNRAATVVFNVPADISRIDDSFYPALGYLIGHMAPNDIPLICGLQGAGVTLDDLKALGAAFATTSAAPMFHILGVTAEAKTAEQALGQTTPARQVELSMDDMRKAWSELNSAASDHVDYVALGNPHFSLTECGRLAELCQTKGRKAVVPITVTCGRDVYARAAEAGIIEKLKDFGVQFINDTCWCLIGEPVIPPAAVNLMTNSAKYAHYGPVATGKGLHFRSLADCVDAACTGKAKAMPAWLA